MASPNFMNPSGFSAYASYAAEGSYGTDQYMQQPAMEDYAPEDVNKSLIEGLSGVQSLSTMFEGSKAGLAGFTAGGTASAAASAGEIFNSIMGIGGGAANAPLVGAGQGVYAANAAGQAGANTAASGATSASAGFNWAGAGMGLVYGAAGGWASDWASGGAGGTGGVGTSIGAAFAPATGGISLAVGFAFDVLAGSFMGNKAEDEARKAAKKFWGQSEEYLGGVEKQNKFKKSATQAAIGASGVRGDTGTAKVYKDELGKNLDEQHSQLKGRLYQQYRKIKKSGGSGGIF